MSLRQLRLCWGGAGAISLDSSSGTIGDDFEVGTESATYDTETTERVETSRRKLVVTAVMATLLPRLRKRQRSAKRFSKPNPYEDRGLDKFAVLKADLAAKREAVAAQIGAPVSMVRFTAGSRTEWIPIVASSSSCKTMSRELSSDSAATRVFTLEGIIPAKLSVKTMSMQDSSRNSTEEHASTDEKAKFSVEERDPSNDAMIHGKPSDYYQKWLKFVQAGTLVGATVVAFVIRKVMVAGVTMSVALAFGLLVKKRHDSNHSGESRDGSWSQDQQQHENNCSSMTSTIYDHHEATKSPRHLHHKADFAALSKRVSSTNVLDSTSLSPKWTNPSTQTVVKADKQKQSRFKSKFLGKHIRKEEPFTEPNSPSATAESNFSYSSSPCTPVMKGGRSSATTFFKRDAHDLGSKALPEKRHPQKLVSQNSHNLIQPQLPLSNLLKSEHRRQKSTRISLPQVALSTGLAIVLGCLLSGRILAILGLSCWWYVQPLLRQLAGDEPSVQGPALAGSQRAGQKRSTPNISVISNHLNNGKLDLNSVEYKKKVIMEGLLDRNRKSTI